MEENEMMKRYLDEEGRIKQYPSKKTVREVVLAYLAGKFEKDRKYTEKEVNEIIRTWICFSDHEIIRRELFTYGFMNRLRDGSCYWLEDKVDL